MDIVLDTNALVMAVSPRSPYHRVWRSFLQGEYTLCLTNEIIEEYAEVMARNLSASISEAIVNAILLRPNIRRIDPHFSFQLIEADPDDNKFVDCAIVANAHFIVSEDHHFKELQRIPFPRVDVIGINAFLVLLNNKNGQNSPS